MPPISQVLAGAAVIVDMSLNATQFAAQFSGVPGLAPALGVLLAISKACDKIQSNKAEALLLQERCRYLILALNDTNYQESKGPEMTRVIEGCTAHLNEVLRVICEYTGLSRWALLYKQKQVSKGIYACHTKLDDCCREFQIRSQIQLHQWMNEHKRAREEDHEQLFHVLMELKEGNEIFRQTLAEDRDQLAIVLGLLQKQLGASAQDSPEYYDLQRGLYDMQKKSGELPPGTNLKAGEARRIGQYPVAGNAAFDIWEGVWLGREKVALKTVRGVYVSPETQKRFNREVAIWREVWEIDRGRYILPFYGACFQDGPYPYMVSPWMNNGDVLCYLKKYPTANRLEIIKGIASGLSLLHNLKPKPIAHGDVKAANVLINDSGQPVLADFGLSKILEDITGVPFTQSKGVSESYRWFAPELCSSPGVISTYSDVFAYGMTVVEIFTDEPPFQHIKRTTEVLLQMQKGERPMKPTETKIIERGLDDHLWEVATGCWEACPEHRPTIDQILAQL
ncbi:kinase-like domain-containing protein [Gautieria morchelliformis]|nr:kinase-like domain-containing protein [Gautieria morchelliformis]